jgi:NTE family protein
VNGTSRRFSACALGLFCILVSAHALPPAGESPPGPRGRPSVALVLAGGGAKGYAHIPVLELIEEMGIPVDMVIGTSAGAIVGGLYCAGYSPRMIRELLFDLDWNAIFQDRPVFPFEHQLGERSLERNLLNVKLSRRFTLNMGSGFSGGQEAYKLFRSLTAKIPSYISFDSLPVPFRATGVELTTGKLEVFAEGDLAEAIRASMSIPAVFEPFSVDGKYYLDGSVLNNLPVDQAKAMGFDVVIAVELPDKLIREARAFDASPLVALNQSLAIYQYSVKESQYALADAVLFTDVEDYFILDFPKAREIYARSERQKDEFREILLGVRKKIFGDSDSFAPPGGDRYSSRPALVPRDLKMSGELPSDTKYIRRQFERLLQNRPAAGEDLAAFIDSVYRTGNYNFVVARLDNREAYPLLELRLFRSDPRSSYLVFGAGFQETIAADVLVKLKAAMAVQLRGLTGPGSVLSLGFTTPQVLSVQALYFQPLDQNWFFSFQGRLEQDQDLVTSGFTWRGQSGSSMLNAEIGAGVGYRFDRANTLRFDASYFAGSWFKGITDYFTFTQASGGDSTTKNIGLSLDWEYSGLDAPVFPSRGLFVNVCNRAYFPAAAEDQGIANIAGFQFTAALPVTDKAGFAFNAFAGGDLAGTLQKRPSQKILLGFNTADRLFFPQISGRQRHGAIKAAASLLAHIRPFRNPWVMGADWFFALASSAGFVCDDLRGLTPQSLYWNATFNTGLRFTRSFGAVLRMGAGKGDGPGHSHHGCYRRSGAS